MATRRERVILDLQDNFSSGMAKAAASTALLDKRLEALDGDLVDVDRHTRQLGSNSGVEKTGASFRKASADIDTFSGRLGLLVTAVGTLGPALVPITAAAVPAVAGLTAGLTAAAGAAGVTMLAFSGMGDSMKALNNYQLEPTAANLAKMEAEFNKLGPAGVEFVRYLDSLSPKLDSLQKLAGQGMFPGMEQGIRSMSTLLPDVREIVSSISTELGTLSASAGKSLAKDPDWQNFFDYLKTDAAPTLDAFGRSTGNFAAGLANMLVAFAPLSRDFTTGLLDMSRSFREWSAGLSDNQSFQEFIDYIRKTGPVVGDFMGSLGSALLGLAKAVEPWGSAVLPVLTAVMDAFTSIANSPVGPALATAGAAFLAFNRTMSVTAGLMNKMGMTGKGGGKVAGTQAGVFGAMGVGAQKAQGSVKNFGSVMRTTAADVKSMRGEMKPASAALMSLQTNPAVKGLRGIGSAAAKAAGPVAAIGALSSGAADKMGLTNTATLGLAGSMAGPLGAAVGAGTGLLMDMAAANNDVTESLQRASSAISAGGSFSDIGTQFRDAQKEVSKFQKSLVPTDEGPGLKGAFAQIKNDLEGVFGDSDLEEVEKKNRKIIDSYSDMTTAGKALANTFGVKLTGNTETDLAAMDAAAQSAAPAMQALGLTTSDLQRAAAQGGGALESLMGRIGAWQAQNDSLAGRSQAVADAIADIGKEAISSAQGADQLATALDALITPEQGLVAAQDQWTTSLRHLNEDLAKNKTLVGQSDAAIKNRAAISDRVTGLKELLTAQAQAGAGPQKLAKTLMEGRANLLKFGEQAGLSRKQMQGFINQLGLTPKVVETVLKRTGFYAGKKEVQEYSDTFKSLPKEVQTKLRTDGVPKSRAEAKKLADQLDLTAKDRRALFKLVDQSPAVFNTIQKKMRQLDQMRANPQTRLVADAAMGAIKTVTGELQGLDKKTANPKVKAQDNATPTINKVDGEMNGLNSKQANPKINAKDNASGTISAVQSGLAAIQSKTVTVTVQRRVTGAASSVAGMFSAEGSMWRGGVQTFAGGGSAGDRPNGHQPQIHRATSNGTVRIWAEPETQGETYIPHANDYRRPRAKSLVEQTAEMFGGEVAWYASGGSRGKKSSSSKSTAEERRERAAERREKAAERREKAAERRQKAAERRKDRAESARGISRDALKAARDAAKEAREAAKQGRQRAARRQLNRALRQRGRARAAVAKARRTGRRPAIRQTRANLRQVQASVRIARQMTRAAAAVKRLTAASKRLEKQVEKERRQRDKWAERRKSVMEDTRAGLKRDLWTSDANVFSTKYAAGSPGYAMEQLRQQRTDAKKLTTAVRKLRKKGLDGAALAEIMSSPDPLAAAQAFAALPGSQVRQYENLYKSSTAWVNKAAKVAGNTAYGKQLNQANKELRQANRRLNRVEKTIRNKTKVDHRSRLKAADRTAKGVRKGTGAGKRNKRYGKR